MLEEQNNAATGENLPLIANEKKPNNIATAEILIANEKKSIN